MQLSKTKGFWIGIGVVTFILVLILNPVVFIRAGQRGVILNWGAVSNELWGEGLHFKIPVYQQIKKMNVTVIKEEHPASAASRDLQDVTTTVAINYRLDSTKVNRVYQDMRYDYSERVITPSIQEFVKKTTAGYTAEQLITHREKVKEDLKSSLTQSLAKSYILLIDVFITDFKFSESFGKAIEAKVTAEQEALQQKNVLEKVKYMAEQRITSATAEAQAIRIQAQAITSAGGRDYVQLKAIEKWNGVLPAQMIPGGTVPFLRLNQQ